MTYGVVSLCGSTTMVVMQKAYHRRNRKLKSGGAGALKTPAVTRKERGKSAFASLNLQQQRAVEAPLRPLLIVAGAGTGKTTTLTNRLLYLIMEGAPAAEICAITFTNKAAKEMADRVADSMGHIAYGKGQKVKDKEAINHTPFAIRSLPYIGTFHSLGARILRTEAKLLGRTPNFAIFDASDSLRLVRQALKGLPAAPKATPSFFLGKISAIKNGVLSLDDLAQAAYAPDPLRQSSSEASRRAAEVYERYENELQKNNAFDFDDLIKKVLDIFRSHPERLTAYQRRYRYLLVDEYQDLNDTQYELIRLLAGDARQITVVGDDQQMIYGWRYANLDIFLNFERDWPQAQVLLLEQNYRSTKTIIDAASAVIRNNRRQKEKTLFTENEAGDPITVFEAADEADESAWVVEQVQNAKSPASPAGRKDQNNGDTAILYRTNAQSRALEQELIDREIPYRIFGGLKFYERREVKDLVAALRYAMNPFDSVSRERLEKLLGKIKFAELEPELRSRRADAPRALIEFFIGRTDYMGYLERAFLNPAERRENVTELIHFASRFELLPEFIERVSLLQATDSTTEEGGQRKEEGAVQLMTIHLAKGLEFDRVFVVGCAEGLLPHARSIESGDQLEEERRLMYVAMTRARRQLSLSFYDIPSRFLFEIPQELTRFESSTRDAASLEDNEERYITID
jgi:DNA helicase II / ATP-dependent DNA helicase PcrA